MADNLQRRTRSAREVQAYRAVQVGAVAGGVFVVSTVLWIAGAISDGLPLVMLLVSVLAGLRFAMVTGWRNSRRRH